jgi:hypothetical protein
MTTPHERKEYLGDGAYVRWDAGTQHIVLTAENGVVATDIIYLEPEVIAALVQYLKAQFPDATFWR